MSGLWIDLGLLLADVVLIWALVWRTRKGR